MTRPAGHRAPAASPDWVPDILGAGYEQTTLDLGTDPDGEGVVAATLVRRTRVAPATDPTDPTDPTGLPGTTRAALYVHGFSDYFFQTELADFFTDRGTAFYAIDLRKSGRARRQGQTAHYVSSLSLHDTELEQALEVIESEHPGAEVTVVAHSTGGLVVPLWLERMRTSGRRHQVTSLVLNSPWLDQQGSAFLRGPLTWLLVPMARWRPHSVLPSALATYGESLHSSSHGAWDFDLDLKPLLGFPVTVGWLNAVRRGHARLHRGIEVGVPTLVLHSDTSDFSPTFSDATHHADVVLDVEQISRWAPTLGARTTTEAIPGARHDVFLSEPTPRARAYTAMETWLAATTVPTTAENHQESR